MSGDADPGLSSQFREVDGRNPWPSWDGREQVPPWQNAVSVDVSFSFGSQAIQPAFTRARLEESGENEFLGNPRWDAEGHRRVTVREFALGRKSEAPRSSRGFRRPLCPSPDEISPQPWPGSRTELPLLWMSR